MTRLYIHDRRRGGRGFSSASRARGQRCAGTCRMPDAVAAYRRSYDHIYTFLAVIYTQRHEHLLTPTTPRISHQAQLRKMSDTRERHSCFHQLSVSRQPARQASCFSWRDNTDDVIGGIITRARQPRLSSFPSPRHATPCRQQRGPGRSKIDVRAQPSCHARLFVVRSPAFMYDDAVAGARTSPRRRGIQRRRACRLDEYRPLASRHAAGFLDGFLRVTGRCWRRQQ